MSVVRKSSRVFDIYYLPINKLPISQISHNNRRKIDLRVTDEEINLDLETKHKILH